MSEEVENPPEMAEKTEEQLLEEQKQREEEERQKEEERKRLEQEARMKKQEDIKKLEEAYKGSLSGLSKTADNRSMAYVKMNLAEKQLQRLFDSISRFKHIQYLDLSSNTLTDLSPLLEIPNLLHLNVSKNQVKSLQTFAVEGKLTKLQYLNISTNKLKKLENLSVPSLRRLNVNQNQIDGVEEWKGHSSIEILEIRNNKLRKFKGFINMRNLKELYACDNEITGIRGLENVNSLVKLSVRKNKIKNILAPFPHLPSLIHLNMRQNLISSLQELKKIDGHIKSINLIGNPVTDELGQNLKKELFYLLPHFTVVNKSPITEEDRVGFEKERLEKLALEEKQRLEKEQVQKAEQAND